MSNAAVSFDAEASALLEQLSTALSAKTGLMLTEAQWIDLRRAIAIVADAQGCGDWMTCLRLLITDEGSVHYQQLIDHLTIGETYFFRDGALFNLLRERLLPDLIRARRDRGKYLRIWSAACCSGEEPYSVAIELLRLLPDWREWQLTLLATDINRRFLQKAERGVYERWSLRHKTLPPYAPYLLPLAKGRFEVAPMLRDVVTFAQLNFASQLYPSNLTNTQNMDIILCRNALMYLQSECIQDVIARLSACLVEGGWLITSTIEASLVQRPELQAVRLPEIVVFRKQTSKGPLATPHRNEAVALNQRDSLQQFVNIVTKTQKIKPAATLTTVALNKSHPLSDISIDALAATRALADKGKLAEARTECEKVLAIDKLNADAYFLYATIQLELGATAAAEKALQRTLYLDEKHIVAHVALANLLQQSTQRRSDAQRHWRSAQKLLQVLPENAVVRDSDGLTVKQMLEMVSPMLATNG